jgi:hypothetical protein
MAPSLPQASPRAWGVGLLGSTTVLHRGTPLSRSHGHQARHDLIRAAARTWDSRIPSARTWRPHLQETGSAMIR